MTETSIDGIHEPSEVVSGNRQHAPYPVELALLVSRCQYRPGWQVALHTDLDRGQGSQGLTLIITTLGLDSYHPDHGETYRVNHYFPVPPASYNSQSWLRWLFEQFLLVEQHECMEFFALTSDDAEPDDTCADCSHPASLHDGRVSECYAVGCVPQHRFRPVKARAVRPFAPNHGPGFDPYAVRELTTNEARRTSFRGTVNPE